jgi:hypothetical protein
MSLKVIKKFSGKKGESAGSVAARLRARNRARAEALAKAKAAAKKRNEDGEGDQVDDINMDAETAEVLFTDKDANLQVLVGEDPVEGGIVVAVATAEKDNVEEEEVLASITVGEGDGEGGEGGEPEETEESKKKKAVEEARAAIKARLKK